MTLKEELEKVKNQIEELSKSDTERLKQLKELKSKQLKLEIEICKQNIGRCFKKLNHEGTVVQYIKIIDTDKVDYRLSGTSTFNKYQYKAILFTNPKLINFEKEEAIPFKEDRVHSSIWGDGNYFLSQLKKHTYKEITLNDWNDAFIELNNKWVKYITEGVVE